MKGRARRRAGSRTSILLLVVLAIAVSACAPRRAPILDPLLGLEDRTPVVMIPGLTGSQLRDRDTGKVLWGTAHGFFFPRDRGYSLALPIVAGEDRLEAFAPILEVKLLGLWKFDIYGSLLRLMESNGYRLGDLDRPRPGDDFFFFPYDWRYGSVAAAQELAGKLEQLRLARGEEVLRVRFICQSNAARIGRYFLKYGGGSLEQAEAGTARGPAEVEVEKLILVATGNGGGLGTFDDLHRGRKYVPLAGRRLRPETIFTMRSIYEALPLYQEQPFFDAEGRLLDVALSDPGNWKGYGWSIYAPRARKRVRKSGRTDLFGDERQRAAFLAEALDHAERLHHLLMRDVEDFGRTRYYSIQNDSEPTPVRALLEPDGDRWQTRIDLRGRGSKRWPLALAPGDGHATVESQMWLSPQEREAFAHPPVYVETEHRRIVLDEDAHRWILEFLLD